MALQLVKDPHSKVFMPLADEYVKAGMWQEAAAVLEDGLKYYPGFITAMVTLGRAYDHMGQPTKAKAILEEAVKLSPENLRAHRTLVKIYAAQGLADAALQSCTVILAVNPRDEEALSIQTQLGGSPISPISPAKIPAPAAKGERSAPETPTPSASAPINSRPTEPDAVDPLAVATALMETTLDGIRRPTVEVALETLDPAPTTSASTAAPSPRVSQLEAWLRSIQSRRHDFDHIKRVKSASS